MRRLRERIRNSADLRLAFHTGAWQFVLVLAAGLLIKFFALDSVVAAGAQMEPSVMSGDRLLVFKLPYRVPLIRDIFARPYKPVVAALPNKNTTTLLRIAAMSGDTVSIEEGQFFRDQNSIEQFGKNTETFSVIPAAFSPADFMAPYKIPGPMDTITFADLTMRDLIFTYSVLRQERSGAKMRAFVVTGDEIRNDYQIKDFALYSGRLDSIPDEFYTDWFFWDRLQGYLDMTANEDADKPQLAFSIFRSGREIHGFRVKKSYVFLLGDNWTGAKDSRYFGPVVKTNIVGRPFLSLWRWKSETDETEDRVNGKKKFDANRIFKVVR